MICCAAPLVNSRANGLDGLTVSYHGHQVRQPYLAIVEINSSGRADIVPSSFDGGKPIRIDLQVPILAELDQRATLETVDAKLELVGGTVIELQPSLLPKGYSLNAAYICEGEPPPTYKVHLPDIKIRNSAPSP